jgi:hypothetical protein
MLHASSTRRYCVFFALACSLGAFTACHARAADPPHLPSPAMQIEVDDRESDKTSHLARWDIAFVDGHAKLRTQDGADRYEIEAAIVRSDTPHISIRLKRDEGDKARDLNIESSIPAQQQGRVLLARVDRADGRTTLVTANVH